MVENFEKKEKKKIYENMTESEKKWATFRRMCQMNEQSLLHKSK